MKQVKNYIIEILPVVCSVVLFIIIILTPNFLILFLWASVRDIFGIALIWFFFFSLLFAMFKLYRYKKFNEQILNENKSKPYYFLFSIYFLFIVLYMFVSSLFTTYNYSFIEYFNRILVTVIALLVVYLPSLFIDMINESVFLSIIYTIIFHIGIQILLFIPLYLTFFISGV
jgi:hypothetical protein